MEALTQVQQPRLSTQPCRAIRPGSLVSPRRFGAVELCVQATVRCVAVEHVPYVRAREQNNTTIPSRILGARRNNVRPSHSLFVVRLPAAFFASPILQLCTFDILTLPSYSPSANIGRPSRPAGATMANTQHLLCQYHHAVLPRNVPSAENSELARVEAALLERLCGAAKEFAHHVPVEHHAAVDAVRLALSTCRTLNVDRTINKNVLAKELQQLGDGRLLILHVTQQNAALLVYPQTR